MPGNTRAGKPDGKRHRNIPPARGPVRVKWRGKSPPAARQRAGRASPIRSKTNRGRNPGFRHLGPGQRPPGQPPGASLPPATAKRPAPATNRAATRGPERWPPPRRCRADRTRLTGRPERRRSRRPRRVYGPAERYWPAAQPRPPSFHQVKPSAVTGPAAITSAEPSGRQATTFALTVGLSCTRRQSPVPLTTAVAPGVSAAEGAALASAVIEGRAAGMAGGAAGAGGAATGLAPAAPSVAAPKSAVQYQPYGELAE